MVRKNGCLPRHPLVGQSFIARGEINDATISETQLDQIMLHDGIIPMCINAQVRLTGSTEREQVPQHIVHIRITGYAMHHVVGQRIIQPLPLVYRAVGRVGRRQEGEISYRPPLVDDDMTATALHVGEQHLFRRITALPLLHVARCPHDSLGSLHYLHDV